MDETTCPRTGKWIGGCRFEGRYDQHPGYSGEINGDTDFVVAVIKAQRITSYVRDVCTTCGRTIERSTSPARTAGEGR